MFIADYNRDRRDDENGREFTEMCVDRFDEPPDGDTWKLGNATINYYSDNARTLRIRLNGTAMGSRSEFPDRLDRLTWAKTMRHEVLHNLGWDHGDFDDDNYDQAWMLAYVDCQFGADGLAKLRM